jgi:arginine deiminase
VRPVNNFSEIKTLKRVLLHRPGNEYLNLTPTSLSRLLFDEIPYLKNAQAEHDRFAELLVDQGVEVVYMVDITTEALSTSPEVRENFIKQFIEEGGVVNERMAEHLFKYLNSIHDNRDLVSKCIEGTDVSEIKDYVEQSNFYQTGDPGRMLLDPIPNLYATRDPFATIGNGISLNNMHFETRKRETIFADYVFKYHPQYQNVKRYYNRDQNYTIEGGDVEVYNEHVVGIGISQRTEPDAISELAQALFDDSEASFNTVLAFDIPNERSFMHLDTVITRVDEDKFAVHSEVMAISRTYVITKADDGGLNIVEENLTLDKILEKYLGIEKVTFIKCGNGNRIAAEREQWSDAANVLCIRPGVVIAYDRNYVTIEAMRQNGIEVLEMPSGELSRGRAGPHCMSMALWREQ